MDADGKGQKTPEKIVAELNQLLMGAATSSGILASLVGDTILLPPQAYQYIALTPYGVTSPNMTILQWFMANNIYTTRTGRPITIRELPALSTAATADGVVGQGRAVGYRNTRDALELPLPMPYRFLDIHQHGPMQWQIPGIGRVGQLIQLREGAVRYLDGVSPAPAE